MKDKEKTKLRNLVFDHINNYLDRAEFPEDNVKLIHYDELCAFVYLDFNTNKFRVGDLDELINLLSSEAMLSFLERRYKLMATA